MSAAALLAVAVLGLTSPAAKSDSARTRKIFVLDATGRAVRIIDRRDGRDIVWTRAEKP